MHAYSEDWREPSPVACIGDVSALAAVEAENSTLLFVGRGSSIVVVDAVSGDIVCQELVLPGGTHVHGIKVLSHDNQPASEREDDVLLIHGDRYYTILLFNKNASGFTTLIKPVPLKRWVMASAIWWRGHNELALALGLANNDVLLLHGDLVQCGLEWTMAVHPAGYFQGQERSLLYSMAIHVDLVRRRYCWKYLSELCIVFGIIVHCLSSKLAESEFADVELKALVVFGCRKASRCSSAQAPSSWTLSFGALNLDETETATTS